MRIFTERLEYWRFIQEFGFDDKTEEERKLDPGIFITKDKEIFYKDELIAKFKPKKK